MEKLLKRLIWVYVVLLIFEGALRKWVLPSLADPLLVVRDPVVIAIYILALFTGRFPFNGWMTAVCGLAVASIVASFVTGQSNLIVMAYGLRINYGHLPLIWIMANTLTRRDVEKLGTFLLLVAIPMTAVMVLQFKSPMNAPINRGIGSEEGGQIYGALGRIRPPGFFSFITGPQVFYPLVAAFFLNQASGHRRLLWPIFIACGLAVLVALPVSISRTAMLATVIVGIVFVCTLPRAGIDIAVYLRAGFALGAVAIAVSFLPVFHDAREAFLARWETASVSSHGDAWGGIWTRIIGGFLQPFHFAAQAKFFGSGIGVGSNVGARLLSGRVGFLLAEDEWSKVFLELGPVLGGAFLGFRLLFTLNLLLRSLIALFENGDNLPLLIFAAWAVPFALNQWAPPTILGFAVIGAGLLLAALNSPVAEEEEEETEEESADEATDGTGAPAESIDLPDPLPAAPVRVRY